ncbi:RagB/SusD family nutrient uptake outer membrane protein [uncultured Parabacteroides sp.]|uniref:RagB/SusD family nutrient uptake outer membrane protein n=1 Tax=uncultured Parabacteroides sp. TaxID=512312 RepID=UPI0025F7122E|nr:RagB/SusD family nutrient uptake outer membrane protein [uncultured Parabacteroides sp.]
MKSLKYSILFLMACALCVSCDESKFLEEKPLDFYSPENSMETSAHFQASINYLYNRTRYLQWGTNTEARFALRYATDFAFNATDYYKPAKLNDYTNVMVPTYSVPLEIWKTCYTIVSNANVILNRLDQSKSITDSDKSSFRGETLFFRAYAYKILANLYGGVPLVLEEVETPRRDYVRATREDVYDQIRKDLEDAETLLDNIDKVKDGKISKQMAEHLLSEIYISLGQYDQAISAATRVIDYPAMGLMTSRFGSRKDEEGDVYWDLFRLDNQNRSSGNTESLWVIQYDYQNPASNTDYNMPWVVLPFYQNLQVTEKDETGKEITTNAFLGVTDGKGGRGVGWMQPTDFFFGDLWKGSENDIRNSSYNIMRDVRIDNPASPAFGKWLVKDGYSKQVDPIRQWFPFLTKVARMNNFPEDLYQKNSNGEPLMTEFGEHLLINNANSSYKDEYMYRLAETYLLRAEAYVGKGDKEKAVADINVIRARANAEPAKASEMDIDYILDERLRELYVEEMRMVTLCRMGRLVDRNRKYNPKSGPSISDFHNLWPIPFSEIERNIFAEIKQNPGY